jgi:hypothetical protein
VVAAVGSLPQRITLLGLRCNPNEVKIASKAIRGKGCFVPACYCYVTKQTLAANCFAMVCLATFGFKFT